MVEGIQGVEVKAIWDGLWNNPVVFIGVITLAAVTVLGEVGDSIPTG